MSSDGYFDDDPIDSAILEQLDAIEAAYYKEAPKRPPLKRASSSDYGVSFNFDESELARLDEIIGDGRQGKVEPVAGPSEHRNKSSSRPVQTTLFGDVLSNPSSKNKSTSKSTAQVSKSTPRNPFGQQAKQTKKWDHTAFAKTGLKQGKSKAKDKWRGSFEDEEEEDVEQVEFEQFPAPFVSVGPPPPMKLKPDPLECKHWIYPLNQPKRDYQFNIVKHCLFENTLVALPTGLGKTFIAGSVMLNFYRWFPEGKVVFVAPTKPLVAQQIDACHKVCGIPGSHAVELTGQIPRAMRSRAWAGKRVFYMTPQTLVNDLTTENCDPMDIVLLVIDEAHRGTGDYSYAQVVRFLMAKNPHFRILALTATPGGTPDAVQEIVDALHISRIEIRDEESLDLKDYIHKKNIKQHIIRMSEDIDKAKDILGKLMDDIIKPLRERGVMYGNANPVHMSAFLPQAIMRKLQKNQRWAFAPLSKLSSLARAMGYLVEGTMSMCYTYLHEIADDTGVDGDEKKNSKAAGFRANPNFQALMKELEVQQARGFSIHPKMDMLKTLVVQYFGQRMGEGDGGEDDGGEATRVMVFVTFRAAVEEIVEVLNAEKPLIRATKFIGQGTDKQGKKGFAQKEQLEVIKKFKAGEFNVLVATSIGEEGLDIGEIDMIVCYDAQKTPIRMLQRLGRTGRRREGYVHVLLAEGREEMNMDKAKATYKEVQRTIVRGEQLELYGDVERLLPDHVKPACLEKVMEIEEYVREDGRKKRDASDSPKGTKRKRNDDLSRNIPQGASTGFVSVKDLLQKGKAKAKAKDTREANKKRKVSNLDDLADEDDEVDAEIEEGMTALRRAASATTVHKSSETAKKGKLKRAATTTGAPSKAKARRKPLPEPTLSQCAEDSDDVDIARGVVSTHLVREKFAQEPSPSPLKHPAVDNDPAVIEVSSDCDGDLSDGWNRPSPMPRARSYSMTASGSSQHIRPNEGKALAPSPKKHEQSMAWLLDEDEDPDIEVVYSSPVLARDTLSVTREASSDVEIVEEERPPDSPVASMSQRDVGESDRSSCSSVSPMFRHGHVSRVSQPSPAVSHRGHQVNEGQAGRSAISSGNVTWTPRVSSPSSPWNIPPDVRRTSQMAGSPDPRDDSQMLAQSTTVDDTPDPSFPLQLPRRRLKKPTLVDPRLQSSPLKMPPPSQRRLQRKQSPSSGPPPEAPKSRKIRAAAIPHKDNPLFDVEAMHSGDEISEGSSQSDEEDESDRAFLHEPTQVSPSYDQSLVYRQSLLTQAPANSKAPKFASNPVRKGVFGGGVPHARRPVLVSSSPPRDDYAFGSFVVDDDAEITYSDASSEI